ncbi:phage tail protein [Morganella morganii]|uniref:phage tail protein n=1 Tax=Morganella morganii TaxID=582 RepID=UPI001FFC2E0A|nr:phage tail protein [Morganella morganii]
MTAKYFAILTNYGAAQLANAVALGTQMNISAMAVGDGGGTLPVPDPAQTKLIRETRRAAVNQVSIDEKNPNFIIAEQVIPENEGGWFIREIGLFDDNGGLIAVGNAPETYKPNLQEGSGRTQVIQMVLMVSNTQAITLKVDPSVVLATREYVTKSIDAAIQASEARAAQTYQPKGDYVTNPYLKLELLKKIDKADITQQLGNDTGKVVSQNLLATELGKKASVADANSKLAKDQNGADIPDKPKFIENLGLGEAAKSDVAQGAGTSKTTVISQDGATKSFASSEFFRYLPNEYTVIYSPNKTYRIVVFNDGAFGSYLTDGGVAIVSFDKTGKMTKGEIPTDKISGLKQSLGSGADTIPSEKAVSDALDKQKPLGMGQSWRDVTFARSAGVTYQNTKNRSIEINVRTERLTGSGVAGITLECDGIVISSNRVSGAGTQAFVSAVIPDKSNYRVAVEGSTIFQWSELTTQ